MYKKLSLEREVDQMVNDMMQKEGWTRSYALSVLRSKFESEERHQEAECVNDLIQKEAEKQEQESEFIPAAGATTTTTIEAEEIGKTTANEPAVTATTTSSMKPSPTQQQKGGQETVSSKSLSKQLDKQTIQINKKITQVLQPIQKQSQLIRQLQSQLKQLQKQVSQIQKVANIGKKKNKKNLFTGGNPCCSIILRLTVLPLFLITRLYLSRYSIASFFDSNIAVPLK
jgi:hypothetical protein